MTAAMQAARAQLKGEVEWVRASEKSARGVRLEVQLVGTAR